MDGRPDGSLTAPCASYPATAGGAGDTSPFIPLARGLTAAGHNVLALVPAAVTNDVEGFGVRTRPSPWSPDDLDPALLDAVVASGRRVIAPRLFGLDETRYAADGALFIDHEPFDRLFPRCARHPARGIGTQALGFVSDVPRFVTPLTIDHTYFGRREHELGVGPRPVHLSEVRAEHVRHAIAFAGLPETRARGAEVGARAEDGVGNAVRFLTRVAPGSLSAVGRSQSRRPPT